MGLIWSGGPIVRGPPAIGQAREMTHFGHKETTSMLARGLSGACLPWTCKPCLCSLPVQVQMFVVAQLAG